MMRPTLLITLGLCLPFSPPLSAQERVEQIVVTGTRTERETQNSPIAVDVISHHELSMVASGTLAEALDYMPGVVVKRSMKDGYNVYLQGFDSDRVLVLVDGQPVVSPTGDAADLSQISALDVERIEVIRGAASVLYGSAAMGGVINVITRNPQRNSLSGSIHRGHYTDYQIDDKSAPHQYHLEANGHFRQAFAQLQYQTMQDPGFNYDANTVAQDAGAIDKTFVRGTFGWRPGDITLRYRPQRLNEQKYKITGPLPNARVNFYQSDVTQTQHDLSIQQLGRWQLQARYIDHQERSGQSTGQRDMNIQNWDLESQYVWLMAQTEWVAGLQYYRETLDQKKLDGTVEVDEAEREGLELFVQSEWAATDHWSLVAGVRAQEDSGYGTHQALRFSAMWQNTLASGTQLTWRSAVGEGYRVPNLKERHFHFDHSNLGYVILGDPDLQPETSQSFNTGLESRGLVGNSHWTTEFNLHYSTAKQFIDTQLDPQQSENAGYSVYAYTNMGEVELYGGDLNLGLQLGQHRGRFSYAYLEAFDQDTGARLSNRPRHQIKTQYWWSLPRLRSELLLYGVYEQDEAFTQAEAITEGYATVNATWRLTLNQHLSWRIGVENLFNEHREIGLQEHLQFDPRPISTRYLFATMNFSWH